MSDESTASDATEDAGVADSAELGESDNLAVSTDDELGLPEDDDPADDEPLAVSFADDDEGVAEGADLGEVADLLAGAVISGNAQAQAAALAAYESTGRSPLQGGPLKFAPAVEEAEGA